jgi:glycosyltransferase involved in cell wall biosynthesis
MCFSGGAVNVLHLISSGGVYGAEKMLMALARALEHKGCHSIVGVFDNVHVGPTPVIQEMATQHLAVESFPCKGRLDWKTVTAIREYIRRSRIDVVHTHGYKADIYGYLATRRPATPILATSHYWTRRTTALRFYAFVDQLLMRRFDKVVAVSDQIADSIVASGTPRKKVVTIDNGIDLLPFCNATPCLRHPPATSESTVIGSVGRLVKQKGYDYLLRAVPGILRKFPNTAFIVVGEGPERPQLEALAEELGIRGKVNFIGERRDMPDVYASFDIFVLPSIDEGMPIALIEALASGRPLIATRVAAVPKLIIHEKTGILVEPKDSQALEEAVCRLLGDRTLQNRLGECGRAWAAEHYSAERMAETYLQMYQEIRCKSPRGRATASSTADAKSL